MLLPPNSDIRSTCGTAAYTLRAVASLALLLLYLRRPAASYRLVGFYLLVTTVLDSIRLYPLWQLALSSVEKNIAGLQSSIAAVSALYLIYEASPSRTSKRQVHVDEENSSTLSRLFFGWLLPLLTFGRSSRLVEADIRHVDYHAYAVHREDRAIQHASVSRTFYATVMVQYMAAIVLSILTAITKLALPFIVGAIVRYMQSDASFSGTFLIMAMFFEYVTYLVALNTAKLTISQLCAGLFQAHATHLTNQVDYKLRSFLTHKVFQRSLAPGAQTGTAESVSARATVLASVDIPTIIEGPDVLRDVVGNAIVVGVASHMLRQQIGLAFLGPLVLAILGTLVPLLLGPKMAFAQRTAREATEKRIQAMKQVLGDVRNVRMGGLQDLTAEQLATFRRVEIERETRFRRILAAVVVIGTSARFFYLKL